MISTTSYNLTDIYVVRIRQQIRASFMTQDQMNNYDLANLYELITIYAFDPHTTITSIVGDDRSVVLTHNDDQQSIYPSLGINLNITDFSTFDLYHMINHVQQYKSYPTWFEGGFAVTHIGYAADIERYTPHIRSIFQDILDDFNTGTDWYIYTIDNLHILVMTINNIIIHLYLRDREDDIHTRLEMMK